MDSAHAALMMELQLRMMADPVIRQRVAADSAMSRMMRTMMEELSPAQRAELERMRPATAPPNRPPVPPPG